jgi:hypothetical protein
MPSRKWDGPAAVPPYIRTGVTDGQAANAEAKRAGTRAALSDDTVVAAVGGGLGGGGGRRAGTVRYIYCAYIRP